MGDDERIVILEKGLAATLEALTAFKELATRQQARVERLEAAVIDLQQNTIVMNCGSLGAHLQEEDW